MASHYSFKLKDCGLAQSLSQWPTLRELARIAVGTSSRSSAGQGKFKQPICIFVPEGL
jgi:hypothetical protein